MPRDAVRMLVAGSGRQRHARFRDLGEFLEPGDVLVVNTSATIPAAAAARRAGGRDVLVHFAPSPRAGEVLIEVRRPDQTGPVRDVLPGERLELAADAALRVISPHAADCVRLWRAEAEMHAPVVTWLERFGKPVTYARTEPRWPLRAYQTVFARDPGSSEMPSAARPFSNALVTQVVARGVQIVPVVLHAGVSSLELGEPPPPEPYRVPAATARAVNEARRNGGRVIAVGTTVVRALETVVSDSAAVCAGQGWTDLVLSRERPSRSVDGIITGWHEPGSTHLALLESVAGEAVVATAYDAALRERYLWHEFGDSCLLFAR